MSRPSPDPKPKPPAETVSGSYVRFVPRRVDGLAGVSEVVVTPDRLRLLAAGNWSNFEFALMIRNNWLRALRRASPRMFGVDSRCIGQRNWRDAEGCRYFLFSTMPALRVHMPVEDDRLEYGKTTFAKIHQLIMQGGFTTDDRTGK